MKVIYFILAAQKCENCFKLVARVLGFEGFRDKKKKQILTRGMESDDLKRGEGMAFFLMP